MSQISYTVIIIAITAIVSFMSFRNRSLFYKLALNPYDVFRKNQWYRVITHGFVHGDMAHLLVNMFVLFSFGSYVEAVLGSISSMGSPIFIIFYLGALIFASIYDIITKRNNYLYNSIGASGAVSAVIFTSILISPWSKIYLMAVLPIPSVVFGVLYIIYEQYMNKRSKGNVNHRAHLWGAAWGLVFPILLEPKLLGNFINEILSVI
ncbi:MAG: rhomboid family intramembrane serine protease [Rikenellaceae bacterium]